VIQRGIILAAVIVVARYDVRPRSQSVDFCGKLERAS